MADPVAPVYIATAQFIEYAMILVGFLLAYYLIRFIATFIAEDDGQWAEKGQNINKVVRQKMEESSIRDTIANERRTLDPALGFILKAQQAADRLRYDNLKEKTTIAISGAEGEMSHVMHHMGTAKRSLHRFELDADHDNQKKSRELYHLSAHALNEFEKAIHENKLSVADEDHEWTNKVEAIRKAAEKLTTTCGQMHDKIQEHIHKRIDDIRKKSVETKKAKTSAADEAAKEKLKGQVLEGRKLKGQVLEGKKK